MQRRRQTFAALWLVCSLLGAPAAWAQTAQNPALGNLLTPSNIVSLSANASVEVTRDVLNLVFSTTREGSDAAMVQAQLKQALEAALGEARKVARPGQLDVSTGNFSLYLRQPPKGGTSLWQGSADLNVEGKDIEAISKLAGRVQTMTVARVGYSVSREARQAVEGDVAAQAIAAFRARADAYAKNFGFGGVVYREIQVSVDEPQVRPMRMMQAVQAMDSMRQEALPVEAGKASVTATVSGSVQMK
jgi:predicted secreted protein